MKKKICSDLANGIENTMLLDTMVNYLWILLIIIFVSILWGCFLYFMHKKLNDSPDIGSYERFQNSVPFIMAFCPCILVFIANSCYLYIWFFRYMQPHIYCDINIF